MPQPRRERSRPAGFCTLLLASFFATTMLVVATARFEESSAATLPDQQDSTTVDAEKTVGADACAECHLAAHGAWRATAHAKSYDTMHRSRKAKEIARRLGIRRIKRAERCISCHYTEVANEDSGRVRVSHGVSCESCHGPARDWLDVHDDFGGPDLTRSSETPEHRAWRIAETKKRGMRRPDDIASLARRCHDCHTIADDELIAAGHPTGEGFEFFAWSQGEVRHNYLGSDGKENRQPAPSHRRIMYVVGRLAAFDRALRALATAKSDAVRSAQGGAARKALADLDAVSRAVPKACDGALARLVADAKAAELDQLDAGALEALAARFAAAAEKVATLDGAQFAAVDSLLPAENTFKGAPHP